MALTKRQLISTAAAAGSAAVLAPMRRASAALDKISVAVIPISPIANSPSISRKNSTARPKKSSPNSLTSSSRKA